MKRSANLEMLFCEVPFLERFQRAKDAGFDAVEFAGWLDKDVDAIARAARAADIPIAAFTGDERYSPIDPLHMDDYIALVECSIQTAKRLGVSLLVTHSNALDADGRVVDRLEELPDSRKLLTMYETYRRLAPVLERADVTLLVEAISRTEHPGVFMDHVDLAADIVQTIGSPNIRLLCDLYHMQANGGRICDTLRRYRDIIGHVHFADVPGRHEPGTGEMNFAAIARCLEDIDYKGLVGFALKPLSGTERAVKAILDIG